MIPRQGHIVNKLSNSMRNDVDNKRMRPNLRTCFKGDWSNIDAESLRAHFDHIPNIQLEDWAQKSKYKK